MVQCRMIRVERKVLFVHRPKYPLDRGRGIAGRSRMEDPEKCTERNVTFVEECAA